MNGNFSRDSFRTSDTSLATYLFSEGYQIIDIDYSNPRAEFVFKDDSQQLNESVRLYSIGKTQVDASTYSRLHRKLTKIVVNQTPWTEGVING